MAITGPHITVGSTTTRADLEAFLKGNTQSGDRLLGKTDKQTGETVLYIAHSRAGLLNRMTGRAADRRSDARDAVMTVFKNYETTLNSSGLTSGSAQIKDLLFTKISERMHAHDGSALRAGEVWRSVIDVETVGKVLPKAAPTATVVPAAASRGPTILDTGLSVQDFRALGGRIAAVQPPLENDEGKLCDGLSQIADTLGDTIGATFDQAHPGRADREAFAFSDGVGLRTQMEKVLTTVLPSDTLSPDVLAQFTAQAFDRAAASLSPDKVVAGADRTIPAGKTGTATITLPSITIGSTTYEPVKFLGVGGYAKVYEFKSTTGDERIAFKVPNKQGDREALDEVVRDVANEIESHRGAEGGGHRNVIGLKGAVRMPDGRIGMALELAPSGDVYGMKDKIAAAIGTGPGKITQEQADVLRLTLVKDMTMGLKHIRDQNMMHLDFKTPNVMIDGNGHAKIADFGTTRAGADIRSMDAPDVANPKYQAPEVLYAKENVSLRDTAVDSKIKEKRGHIQDAMKQIFGKIRSGVLQDMCEHILKSQFETMRADAEAAKAQVRFTNAADTWALGIAAAELFLGDFNAGGRGDRWDSEIQEDLVAFGQNSAGVALAAPQADGSLAPGSLAKETHSAPVNAMINEMLSRDPGDRPSLADMLDAGPLNGRGVGGDLAHALIAALAGGDAGQIDLVKGRLAARLQ